MVGTSDDTTKNIDLYFVSLLKQLGYDASLKTLSASVEYSYVEDSRNKAQISYTYWSPDYTSASNFLNVVVGCNGFHEASAASPNLSEYCDPSVQTKVDQALATQQADVSSANTQWAAIDKTHHRRRPASESVQFQSTGFRVLAAGELPVQPGSDGQLPHRPGLGEVTTGHRVGRSAERSSPAGGDVSRRRHRAGPLAAGVAPVPPQSLQQCLRCCCSCSSASPASLAPIYASHIAHTRPFTSNLSGTTLVGGKPVPVIQPNPSGLGSTPIGPTWSARYFLGADTQGRDVAARLLLCRTHLAGRGSGFGGHHRHHCGRRSR